MTLVRSWVSRYIIIINTRTDREIINIADSDTCLSLSPPIFTPGTCCRPRALGDVYFCIRSCQRRKCIAFWLCKQPGWECARVCVKFHVRHIQINAVPLERSPGDADERLNISALKARVSLELRKCESAIFASLYLSTPHDSMKPRSTQPTSKQSISTQPTGLDFTLTQPNLITWNTFEPNLIQNNLVRPNFRLN